VRKCIRFHPGPDEEPVVLAEFTLLDGIVTAEYFDTAFERQIERSGLFTFAGTLRPNDGERFFVSLERAFANSSRYTVVTMTSS
jgi:hypothetical protein